MNNCYCSGCHRNLNVDDFFITTLEGERLSRLCSDCRDRFGVEDKRRCTMCKKSRILSEYKIKLNGLINKTCISCCLGQKKYAKKPTKYVKPPKKEKKILVEQLIQDEDICDNCQHLKKSSEIDKFYKVCYECLYTNGV